MEILRRLIAYLCLIASLSLLGMHASSAADGPPVFNNGPYLLAPKTDSMVVAWESSKAVPATIYYGTDKDRLENKVVVSPDKNAPEFQGAKMNLYHVKLDKLRSSDKGTRYFYRVELEGGQSLSASFATLGAKPGATKIITVSDSHIFATRAKFDANVKSVDPAFIIHTGDIVEGTGAQTDQFTFWFKAKLEGDFIHSYPVVYSAGNHDQGGEYANAYVYNTQDAEYGGTVRGNSAFDYAGAHFILMNSNPWGLFLVNSEASGKKADPETIKTVDDTVAWLKSDLAGDNAKRAAFRILTLHHPNSEAYTKRFITPVAESGKVDLTIGGHWHAYSRTVSDNPEVGAGTVHITQQDSRILSKKGGYIVIDLDAAAGLMTVNNHASETAELVNTTQIAKDKQQLSWSDVTISPTEILSNGSVTVSAVVKNEGKGLAAAVLPIEDNGKKRYLYQINGNVTLLEPGKSATLKGELPLAELGTHKLTLAGKAVDVNVLFRKATFDFAKLRTRLGDGAVSDVKHNVLYIKADVKNIGNEPGVASADFSIDGKVVASKKYSLQAGETKTAEFKHAFDQAGTYKVAIGNAKPEEVFIDGAIRGIPIVKDKSGNGNYGLIHGAPELGTDEQGRTTLILDGKRDYIEIPDKGGYKVTDAATGMVWANLPGAGTTKGGLTELVEPYTDGKGVPADHNPLMFKGINLGWGTPYLFRIAVRETGKVTYGLCFEDDNGEFQWNDSSDPKAGIKKDTWVQYTSAFDFKSGGDSYQNGFRSAGVEKPAFGDAPVRNWEGTPLRIGHGFKNTILKQRGRGLYYTMLPGAISQVRFYTSKISAAENDAIRANPTAAHDSAKHLRIWLDFDPANLITKGTHTTEWVEVTDRPNALRYKADFSGKARVVVTVQTSDNQSKVKSSQRFTLVSGEKSIDLKALGKARYVRIVSELQSDLNRSASSVPVIHEYLLEAGTSKRWNTLVDWTRGSFSQAAGYHSGDNYRNHAVDFADYSGEASAPDKL